MEPKIIKSALAENQRMLLEESIVHDQIIDWRYRSHMHNAIVEHEGRDNFINMIANDKEPFSSIFENIHNMNIVTNVAKEASMPYQGVDRCYLLLMTSKKTNTSTEWFQETAKESMSGFFLNINQHSIVIDVSTELFEQDTWNKKKEKQIPFDSFELQGGEGLLFDSNKLVRLYYPSRNNASISLHFTLYEVEPSIQNARQSLIDEHIVLNNGIKA